LATAEFAYNNSYQETIRTSPFYANYGQHPAHEPMCHTISGDMTQNEEMTQLHEALKAEMTSAQLSHKEEADRHRKPDPNLKAGDKVWFLPRNVRTTRPSRKLDYKKLGPFKILARVGPKAYKLDFPPSLKGIHPNIHISLLEPYTNNPLPSQKKEPPTPIEIEGDPEYELDEIIDSRLYRNKLQYKAKWTGYSAKHDQEWYPVSNFENAENAIANFHQQYPTKPNVPGRANRGTRLGMERQ